MPKSALLTASLALSLAFALAARATPEMASRTGRSCSDCHETPSGGELSEQGRSFAAAGYRLDDGEPAASFSHRWLLVLILGFVHVAFAVVWFGTIFYIHIFVRPQKLSGGLPRREMILGWTCIAALLVTGIALTLLRISEPEELTTSTFGIVWMIKVGAFLSMVAIASLVTTRLNRKMREAAARRGGSEDERNTVEYQGRLYDVSRSRMWTDGVHAGRHRVGEDLTAAMKDAPHGAEVLERIAELGPARQSGPEGRSGPPRLFVSLAYTNLVLMLVILLCVAYWSWGPPLVSAGTGPEAEAEGAEREVAASEKSARCIACHLEESVLPVQIDQWGASRHAKNGVGCHECHRAEPDDSDAFEHHGFTVSTIVSPADCARCHPDQAEQFRSSRHSRGGDILASLDNFLGEVVEGMPAAISGCQGCHGTKVGVDESGRLSPQSWPNTGIGRINPDGSKGSCSACHPRHRFSAAVARRPENCGRCHLGPDHPQAEIYRESKHGIVFAEAQDRMHLDAGDWILGETYGAAPTCVTCHSGANGKLGSTHDVGARLSWTLRPQISSHLEDWKRRRAEMKITCRHCHSPGWTDSFFIQFDNAVGLYNDKFGRPAAEVMEKLRDAGELSETPFDEEIEWTYFHLWHHEGRRARHGAAMMGPDYVQWEGFFEVAERFYLEFLPQAEEMLPGVTDGIRADDRHAWLEGAPDEIRDKIKSFYEQRYRLDEVPDLR